MAQEIEAGFLQPPETTRPRCYWYWIDGHISKEGITRDLEAMKRVGIGEGYIGIIGGGEVKALTDPWWGLVEHAVREGGRIGVDIGLFNCPGWSQSGGPWIKPRQSMRYVTMSETPLRGPQRFTGRLAIPPANKAAAGDAATADSAGPAALPATEFQDIAVLAFPAVAGDQETIARRSPRITGDARSDGITYELAEPFTARSVTVLPKKAINVTAELVVSDDGKQFRSVRKFSVDRHNLGPAVGPIPLAPITVSIPATTARFFRIAFSAPCEPGEICISAAARVESYMEKQLAKVFQDPQPPADFYSWKTPGEPDRAEAMIKADTVRDITKHVAADGTLTWDVPDGEWIVLRIGALPTGVKNSPAPPEATGLEVDKMSRSALAGHFDAYLGTLLKRFGSEKERGALKHIVADSYEMGPQNWTDDFLADFKSRYGYEALRYFPVMSGRIVGSAAESDRFLWDLRRMVADRVARDYVGGLRDLCRKHGLKMWLENYGHWGFPGEFLSYGGSCDEIGGEFWADGNLGSVELRAAASAAHIYGMPVVWAEAFTGGPAFRSTPASLKARGDWSLAEGVNQFVLHVYIHQPWEDRRPGVNAWFGTEFNRHNTWFDHSKPWIDYHRRCSVMLQAGKPVADVAYFIGEDAPKMTGQRTPELPAGYDFDYVNADVIQNRLAVKEGRFVLPDGMSYKLLVLPSGKTMRPAVLKKIGELAAAGGRVVGVAPERSPSLKDYPACDDQVRRLAAALWDAGTIKPVADLTSALRDLQAPPDALCPDGIVWKHRRDGEVDIYFLANQKPTPRTEVISLRVAERAPELWWPETGRMERPAVYRTDGGRVQLPIHFGPQTSVFVVFRSPASKDRVVDVTRDGQGLFDWNVVQAAAGGESSGSFTMALWARPEADTVLLAEVASGVHGLQAARNDAVAAQHGGTFGSGAAHAGAGIAIGRNGISVFEHGGGYFAPVLVHKAAVNDWTHVAVVYRENRPTLYLDGKPARTGLQSSRVVHSSIPAAGGNPQFVGALGATEAISRALDEGEVVKLMGRMPRSPAEMAGLPIELTVDAGGQIAARINNAGRYELQTAAGTTLTRDVATVPAAVEVPGPWGVTFRAELGGPEPTMSFARLQDWSKHGDPSVRFYSGPATYRRTFELSSTPRPRWLDLGDVRSIARVRLNDKDLGTLWKAPYRMEVGELLRTGQNTLEIEVVNTWVNRLLGDDEKITPKRWTNTVTKTWKPPLQPSGLLGPVRLLSEVEAK